MMKVQGINSFYHGKVKSHFKNMEDSIIENEKLLHKTASIAGILGLCLIAKTIIKPNGVPDLYKEYVKNAENSNKIELTSETQNKKINKIDELNLKIEEATNALNKDIQEQERIINQLSYTKYDNNKEYLQQQYNILNNFINSEKAELDKLKSQLKKEKNNINNYVKTCN